MGGPRKSALLLTMLVVCVALAAFVVLRGFVRRGAGQGWGAEHTSADVVERLELVVDVRKPPRVEIDALLQLRAGSRGEFAFVLNKALEPSAIVDDAGRELEWIDQGRVRSEFFAEARALRVELEHPTKQIRVRAGGRGMDGSEQRDWMGILLAASDEIRMSVQAAFYPQIPLALDGPGVRVWPTRMRVLAPEGFEIHAPGTPGGVQPAPEGGIEQAFELERGGALSLFAAPRSRMVARAGEVSVALLLTREHTHLGPELAREVERILGRHSAAWGAVEAQFLGIVETIGRGASNDWASYGTIALERREFENGVPVEALAHELAHLWWGEAVPARGRGERFLTEGLAEYASWRHAETDSDGSASRAQAIQARSQWWDAAHAHRADPAVLDVRFSTKGYQAFAYAKGPAALWELHERLGVMHMDALLLDYRGRASSNIEDGAEAFLAALRAHAPSESAERLALLFDGAGHQHLALTDVVFRGAEVVASVLWSTCPAGVRAPERIECTLVAYTAEGRVEREVTFAAEPEPRVAWTAPSEILCVQLRPHGLRTYEPVITIASSALGLVECEPAYGAVDVPLGRVRFRLRFGHALADPPASFGSTIESASRAAESPLRVHATQVIADGSVLEVEFDGTRPGHDHVLVMPEGLTTRSGIPVGSARIDFRTREASDAQIPRIVATIPMPDATGVSTALPRIEIRFSEPMRKARGFRKTKIRELDERGWKHPPSRDARWLDDHTFVLDVETPLEPGRRYGLVLDESFASALGVPPETFELLFETAR